MEFIKAGGSYAIVLVKKLQLLRLRIGIVPVFAPSKRFLSKDKDLLQLRKYSIKMQLGPQVKFCTLVLMFV
jgi:hypothetical protein